MTEALDAYRRVLAVAKGPEDYDLAYTLLRILFAKSLVELEAALQLAPLELRRKWLDMLVLDVVVRQGRHYDRVPLLLALGADPSRVPASVVKLVYGRDPWLALRSGPAIWRRLPGYDWPLLEEWSADFTGALQAAVGPQLTRYLSRVM